MVTSKDFLESFIIKKNICYSFQRIWVIVQEASNNYWD